MWSWRWTLIEPVAVHVPVLSEKISADASRFAAGSLPPVTSTRPSARVVAVCCHRAVIIGPVSDQRLNVGL